MIVVIAAVVMAVLVLAAAGAGGFYVLKKRSEPPPETPPPTPAPTAKEERRFSQIATDRRPTVDELLQQPLDVVLDRYPEMSRVAEPDTLREDWKPGELDGVAPYELRNALEDLIAQGVFDPPSLKPKSVNHGFIRGGSDGPLIPKLTGNHVQTHKFYNFENNNIDVPDMMTARLPFDEAKPGMVISMGPAPDAPGAAGGPYTATVLDVGGDQHTIKWDPVEKGGPPDDRPEDEREEPRETKMGKDHWDGAGQAQRRYRPLRKAGGNDIRQFLASVPTVDAEDPSGHELTPDELRTLINQHVLGDQLRVAGRAPEVVYQDDAMGIMARYEQAMFAHLHLSEQTSGINSPDTTRVRWHLGNVYQATGQIDKAIPHLQQCLVHTRSDTRSKHPDLCHMLWSLGDAMRAVPDGSHDEEAALLLLESLRCTLGVGGGKHPDVGGVRFSCHRLANRIRANTTHDLLPAFLRTLSPDHPDTPWVRWDMANTAQGESCRQVMELYEEAMRRTLSLFKDPVSSAVLNLNEMDTSVFTAYARRNLGVVRTMLGTYPEAEEDLLECLQVFQDHVGRDHVDTGHVHRRVAVTQHLMGKNEEALEQLQHSRQIAAATCGPDHPDTGRVLYWMGNVCLAMGGTEWLGEAEVHFRESMRVFSMNYGPDHPDTTRVKYGLGRALLALGDHEGAAAELRKCLRSHLIFLGSEHPDVAQVRWRLGDALHHLGMGEQATAELREALRVSLATLGPDHADTAGVRWSLAVALRSLNDNTHASFDPTRRFPSALQLSPQRVRGHPQLVREGGDDRSDEGEESPQAGGGRGSGAGPQPRAAVPWILRAFPAGRGTTGRAAAERRWRSLQWLRAEGVQGLDRAEQILRQHLDGSYIDSFATFALIAALAAAAAVAACTEPRDAAFLEQEALRWNEEMNNLLARRATLLQLRDQGRISFADVKQGMAVTMTPEAPAFVAGQHFFSGVVIHKTAEHAVVRWNDSRNGGPPAQSGLAKNTSNEHRSWWDGNAQPGILPRLPGLEEPLAAVEEAITKHQKSKPPPPPASGPAVGRSWQHAVGSRRHPSDGWSRDPTVGAQVKMPPPGHDPHKPKWGRVVDVYGDHVTINFTDPKVGTHNVRRDYWHRVPKEFDDLIPPGFVPPRSQLEFSPPLQLGVPLRPTHPIQTSQSMSPPHTGSSPFLARQRSLSKSASPDHLSPPRRAHVGQIKPTSDLVLPAGWHNPQYAPPNYAPIHAIDADLDDHLQEVRGLRLGFDYLGRIPHQFAVGLVALGAAVSATAAGAAALARPGGPSPPRARMASPPPRPPHRVGDAPPPFVVGDNLALPHDDGASPYAPAMRHAAAPPPPIPRPPQHVPGPQQGGRTPQGAPIPPPRRGGSGRRRAGSGRRAF